MSKHAVVTGAAIATGVALFLAPASAMAAPPSPTVISTVGSGSSVGAISTPTATVVNHPPYGKVYQLRGTISGSKTGDWVRVLDANNQRVPGFKAFRLTNPISNYTVYFTPGSMGGNYKVQIGNQTSGAVYLQPLTSANSAAVQSPAGGA